MAPHYFATAELFRAWLHTHHDSATELIVGYWKKGSGESGMSWPESVNEALCYGWIDGVRKRIDDERYQIRFTPRRTNSIWSAVNIRYVCELIAAGRMQPSGLRAYAARKAERSAVYAYENEAGAFDAADTTKFEANAGAWQIFTTQAPSYQRVCVHWVNAAKKSETRQRRLDQLIAESALSRRLR